MRALQPVRGTQDLLPEVARRHHCVVERARAVAETSRSAEMATPIFEFTEVFARPIGEHTDIVAKEMYTFTDRGGGVDFTAGEHCRGSSLRDLQWPYPECAAQILLQRSDVPLRTPTKKGRFRQFHQIGVELIGVAQPQADIEVIALGNRILEVLGVGQRVELELNTLGDPASCVSYRHALLAYFSARVSESSADSRRRLERNPLRIFDSKEETDQRVARDAPPFADYLNYEFRQFFDQVQAGLDRLGIGYRLNPRLVRGLDYYTHTAFEFVTANLGAQGTVMGGGRYDGLVELMGGPPLPGVGWAAGIERLAMLIATPPPPQPVALVPIGEACEIVALKLAEDLRSQGLPVDLGYSGNLGRRLRRADKIGAFAAILLGDDELARGVATVRDLISGTQNEVLLSDLPTRLRVLAAERTGAN